MAVHSYKEAGVDIGRGDAFARYIGSLKSPAVSKTLGGFSGGLELDTARYKHPVILSTTDGVGTKLLIAKTLGQYSTIGIDLVAMCVNDLIVTNAQPMLFLDYIACGSINEKTLHAVIQGVVKGCEQAGCSLAGGETAEMPDMYGADDIDLAGFSVGVAEKEDILPKREQMRSGDVIIGLPSVGIHSNGLSLARKIITPSDGTLYQQLLTPTKIYVQEMKTLLTSGAVLGAAHITGGGLEGNVARVIPKELKPRFYWNWPEPEIFSAIREKGSVSEDEMRKVFNLGIGVACIVHKEDTDTMMQLAREHGISVIPIGKLIDG